MLHVLSELMFIPERLMLVGAIGDSICVLTELMFIPERLMSVLVDGQYVYLLS